MTRRTITGYLPLKCCIAAYALVFQLPAMAQSAPSNPPAANTTPLSESGPTFVVSDDQLSKHVTLIAYGDQRREHFSSGSGLVK